MNEPEDREGVIRSPGVRPLRAHPGDRGFLRAPGVTPFWRYPREFDDSSLASSSDGLALIYTAIIYLWDVFSRIPQLVSPSSLREHCRVDRNGRLSTRRLPVNTHFHKIANSKLTNCFGSPSGRNKIILCRDYFFMLPNIFFRDCLETIVKLRHSDLYFRSQEVRKFRRRVWYLNSILETAWRETPRTPDLVPLYYPLLNIFSSYWRL